MAKNKVETNSTFDRRKKAQTNVAKILSRGANRHEFTIPFEQNTHVFLESNMTFQTQTLSSEQL